MKRTTFEKEAVQTDDATEKIWKLIEDGESSDSMWQTYLYYLDANNLVSSYYKHELFSVINYIVGPTLIYHATFISSISKL